MEYELIVLEHRTYLVPKKHVHDAPTHESLSPWEVSADDALAWQRAQLDAAVQKIGAMTGALERALAGGDPSDLGVNLDPTRAQEEARRGALAVKARGGANGVATRWDGPAGDRLGAAVRHALDSLTKD